MRRHSVCIHNPPCCYITDAGTDSTLTECCFPQCKNHPKKKKPHNSASNLRYNKRRDSAQLLPKHCYEPHFSSIKCNKTKTQLLNYENKVLKHDLKKTKHKSLRKHEEASSYDVGSVSSNCTSLSVDVTYEMDAVNKDIETILARYEKTFDEKALDAIGPRFKTTDRGRHYRQKKETLTSEQLKLLSMDKPPLDKLKELPIEYIEHLKPRPPPSHFQREKVLTGHNKGVKKDLKQSFEAFIQKEQRTGETQKSEALESMWKNVVERGLAKENLSKNIKPIYTSMNLDENASININFGKLNSNEEARQKRGTSVGTIISPRTKTNPSVSTQTAVDYDTILNRIKGTSSVIIGSSKKVEDFQKKSISDCSPDVKNWKEFSNDLEIGCGEKGGDANRMSPPTRNPKSSGDGSSKDDARLILEQLLSSKSDPRVKPKSSTTVFTPLQQKELNVYNVHASEGVNIFKQADWFKSCAEQFLNSNGLISTKKTTESDPSEKLITTINSRTSKEDSNKVKENSPPTIEESHIEGFSKSLPQLDTSSITDDKLKAFSENINASKKFIDHIAGQDDEITCSFFQTISPDLKFLKENYEGQDTPVCVDIIKRLTDAMMKYEPGKISDELTKRNCHICLEEVRKIRAQHLKHIQIEVKHIEEIDKSFEHLMDLND